MITMWRKRLHEGHCMLVEAFGNQVITDKEDKERFRASIWRWTLERRYSV